MHVFLVALCFAFFASLCVALASHRPWGRASYTAPDGDNIEYTLAQHAEDGAFVALGDGVPEAWTALRQWGSAKGVVLLEQYDPAPLSLFQAPIRHTLLAWLGETFGQDAVAIERREYSAYADDERLVVGFGSFWQNNVPRPRHALLFFTERFQYDARKASILWESRPAGGEASVFLPITFSFAIRKHMVDAARGRYPVGQAHFLWFPQVPAHPPAGGLKGFPVKNARLLIWSATTPRREAVVQALRPHCSVELMVGTPEVAAAGLRSKKGLILLNTRSNDDSQHLEVHRLTQSAVVGVPVISERSDDAYLEELLYAKGLIHSVWSGRPADIRACIREALDRHAEVVQTQGLPDASVSKPLWWR